MARFLSPKENGLHVAICPVCKKKRLLKLWPSNRGGPCQPCSAKTRAPRAVFCVPDEGVRRYLDGESAQSLARAYGVTPATIIKAFKRQGVACRNIKEASAFVDHSPMLEAMKALRATGELQRRCSATQQGVSLGEWTGFRRSHWARIVNTKEWAAWRTAVFTRDGFACVLCGDPGARRSRLQPHHIRPKAKYPELVFEVSNGITLCVPCHRTTFGKEAEFEPAFIAILAERAGR